MKKVVKKIAHKETEFEMLARLMQDGFARVDEKFEKIDSRFEQIDSRFEKIDSRFDLIDSQLFSINHELKDHRQRLDRIERKQAGALANLDESVHRSEFKTLSRRVDALEKKAIKK